MNIVQRTRRRLLLVLISLLLLTAVIPPADAGAPVLEIIVSRGDTLNDLCTAHLADPAQCGQIARFNQLQDPNRIEPGQRLLFPYGLLKVRPERQITGSVAYANGDVSLRETGEAPWRPLTAGAAVRQGNWVRTGRDGRAKLAFDDHSSLQLHPGTEIEVRVLKEQGPGLVRRVFLGIGKLFATVRKAAGTTFDIETTTAVAGSRGTAFMVAFPDDRIMRTAVEEGTVGVSAMGQEVVVREGEGTVVTPGAPPEPPRKLLPPPEPIALQERYRAAPLVIRFSPVAGAAQYRVLLARDPEAENIVLEQVIGIDQGFRAEALDDGTYHLTVRSIDAGGLEGPASGPVTIAVSIEPPQPAAVEETPAGRRMEGYLVLIMAIAAALLF